MIVALKKLIVNGKKVEVGQEVVGISKQELDILLLKKVVERQTKKVEKKSK